MHRRCEEWRDHAKLGPLTVMGQTPVAPRAYEVLLEA